MKKLLLIVLVACTAACMQLFMGSTSFAVNTADFDPGRIIDDGIFYNKDSMSLNDIQAFLNAHVPTCDTWGTQPSGYGNLTDAQYAQQVMGWPGPPYVCLNNYYENPSTGQTSFEMGGGAFSGGLSAAQIIYNAAQQYSINPKVLLVTIRKESLNLFSDSWPMKSQYAYAMGYACPDSGPNNSANCNANYAGFYNQVTKSAWQLRYYYDHMGSYNYAPGRYNTIQYSTDPSCGTANIYIKNYATASLYIYTPYTPNQASLNAYPGTAPCGSYGNRNFWYIWQEWFGTTYTDGNFVRTTDNATVYLIGNNEKYPIPSYSLISAASILGNVGYVSQQYLDSIPTGPTMGRFIQSPDGTIYYYDSSIKLPLTSCTLVTDYGGACGSIPVLTQPEIDNFVTGPSLSNFMGTTSGKKFYIKDGKKEEILDDQSLASTGLTMGSLNVLTDSALDTIPYGTPIVRDGVSIRSRQSSTGNYLISRGGKVQLPDTLSVNKTFSTLPKGVLDQQSIDQLTSQGSADGLIKDETGTTYLITTDGKKIVPDAQSFPSDNVLALPSQLISILYGSGSLSNPSLIKSYDNATVYAIVNGQKRPLVAMEDLKSITGESAPYIAWLPDNVVDSIPTGNIIIGAGRLVMTPSNATVYMTDGYDKLIPMSTFDPAFDMGTPIPIRTISDAILSKYSVDHTVLSTYISCNGNTYVAIGGFIYPITIDGKIARVLQPQTCNMLTIKTALPGFLLAPYGTIFQFKNGTLYPISSWSTYMSLSASGGTTVTATYSTLSLFPQGPTL